MTSTTTGKAGASSTAKDDLRLQANLQVLKRKDPLVSHIVDSTPHVTLYRYVVGGSSPDAGAGGWTKEGVEGTMFLFARTARPTHGIFIMNRLSTSNYYLPLTSDLVWLSSGDYLMFKAHDNNTYGIWFFEKADRDKFFQVISHFCKQEAEGGGGNAAGRAGAAGATQGSRPTSSSSSAAAPTATSASKSGGSRSGGSATSSSSAKLLASAQNDLMGMIQRARGASGTADPGSTSMNSTASNVSPAAPAPAPAPVGAHAGDSDMARLMAKLSTASPSLVPVALDAAGPSASAGRQTSPKRAKSPPKKAVPASPTKPATAVPTSGSPTKPTGAAAAHEPTTAQAQPVDPFRLAHATMSLVPTLPPGVPSREALRDTLIARVTNDPLFLDAVWTTYAQMSAAAAMGMPPMGSAMPPMPLGARPTGPPQLPLGPLAPHVPYAGGPVFGGAGTAAAPPGPGASLLNGAHVSPASMALGMGGLPLAAGAGPLVAQGVRGPLPGPAGMGHPHPQQSQARMGQPMMGMAGAYPQHR